MLCSLKLDHPPELVQVAAASRFPNASMKELCRFFFFIIACFTLEVHLITYKLTNDRESHCCESRMKDCY